jgi:two-component system, sensor histidine kinase and response regulator
MEATEGQSITEEHGGRKLLVLVIDDSPQYGRLLELLSEKLGITAHRVSNCRQGIAALKKLSFDVVMMDWLMPEVDGAACTAQIRAMEALHGRRTPIIGVTGYIKVNRKMCLDAGMDDYLSVPFTLEELTAKLSLWLKAKAE